MKKVLFSLGVLGIFANADAAQHLFMRQNEPLIEEFSSKPAKLECNPKCNPFDSNDFPSATKVKSIVCSINRNNERLIRIVSSFANQETKIIDRNIFKNSVIVHIHDSKVELSPIGTTYITPLCTLSSVTFGAGSQLERIDPFVFFKTGIEEVSIPNGVRELGHRCFSHCERLRRVTFGPNSKLEHIGDDAFLNTRIESLSMPDSVLELGDRCFCECNGLRRVIFGKGSSLVRIGSQAFSSAWCLSAPAITSICIPDSVVELGEKCFYQCLSKGNGTMILHQEGIASDRIIRDPLCKLFCSHQCIRDFPDLIEKIPALSNERCIDLLLRSRKKTAEYRMGMHHGIDIRILDIYKPVHPALNTEPEIRCKILSIGDPDFRDILCAQ